MSFPRLPRPEGLPDQVSSTVRICSCTLHLTFRDAKLTDSRRHIDKHIRPYICKDLLCKGRDFGDKGGLSRHQKEVHGINNPKIYLCPVRTCKRHQKGFPRKYNLFDHQKRRHPQPSTPLPAPSQILRQLGEETRESNTNEGPGDDTRREAAMVDYSSANLTIGEGELRAKLQNLHAVRMELDGDILTLEKALGIIGDTYL